MLTGYNYQAIYMIILVTSLIVNICYAIILKKQIKEFKLLKYYTVSVIPILLLTLIDTIILNFLHKVMSESFLSFIIFSLIAFCMTIISSFIVLMKKSEKKYTLEVLKNITHF